MKFRDNGLGLHDMLSMSWEWRKDYHNSSHDTHLHEIKATHRSQQYSCHQAHPPTSQSTVYQSCRK